MVNLQRFRKYFSRPRQKNAAEAYNLWSASYDAQPDNLMLHLDERIFLQLLDRIELRNRTVIDIGCGTGRHWNRIQSRGPLQLAGYDVSDGMLTELKKKFPGASVQLSTDDVLSGVSDLSADVIISTLTIAHMPQLEEVIKAWARVLKPGGDVLLTDFHPALLAQGGKRDFQSKKTTVIIDNFIHPLSLVLQLAEENHLLLQHKEEIFIDEQVRPYYEKQHALAVYERFKGFPLIYGLHLKKQ
ncbi:MAG: class I SAM-dependent methyltransferase [Flavisolibacter sp.]